MGYRRLRISIHKSSAGSKGFVKKQSQSLALEGTLLLAGEGAKSLGVPMAYFYADSSYLAEVILAFGLLPEQEQRRLAVELKARVSAPAAKARSTRRTPAARHPR